MYKPSVQEAKPEEVVHDEAKEEEEKVGPEPLTQLITTFSRSASTEPTSVLSADFLYFSCAIIMGQVRAPLYAEKNDCGVVVNAYCFNYI